MKFGDAADVASVVLASVFAARDSLKPSEWAERYREIAEGARKGRMDLSKTPNLRAVMDAVADPACRVLTVPAAAQCGKTTGILFTLIMWSWDQSPGNWMVMLPKTEKAEFYNTGRFQPEVEKTSRALRHLVGGLAGQRAGLITTTSGTVEWIGSNSITNAEGTPARFTAIDEYDRCFATAIKKLGQRGKTFADKKEIETGTPGYAGVGIDARYHAAGRRYRWWVPCPHCLHYHTREWEKVKWDGAKQAEPAYVRRTAWMECPREKECGKRITAEDRAWQGRMGVWLCQTQTIGPVQRTDQGDQPGVVYGEAPESEHWGFWISGLDNDLLPNAPGEVAADWLSDVREFGFGSPTWVMEGLGRAYAPRARKLEIEALVAKCRSSVHSMGTAPPGAIGLIAAADVQADRIEWLQLAYGPHGRDVWIVGMGRAPWATDAQLAKALDDVKKLRVPLATAPGQAKAWLPTMYVVVDTGHKATELYAYRALRGNTVKLIKGDSVKHDKRGWLFRKSEQGATGMKKVPLLTIATTPWKDRIFGQLTGKPGKPAGGTSDGSLGDLGSALHLPRDAPRELLEHLVSEHFVGGLWAKKSERLRNEMLDCLVYGVSSLVWYGVEDQRVSQAIIEGTKHVERPERRERPEREPRFHNPLG